MKVAHIVAIVSLFGSSASGAVVFVSPDKLSFGAVALGSSAEQNVGINNPTKKVLNILSVTIDGDFFIPYWPCGTVVPVSSGCGFVVRFAPTDYGLRTGTLTITTDSVDSPYKIKLSGIGASLEMLSLTATPTAPVAPKGSTQQFTAWAAFNDGTFQDVTGSAVWSSSNPSVATITTSGLASALADGNTTIKAVYGSFSSGAAMTVGRAELRFILVQPTNPNVPIGVVTQFTATGVFLDGATQDLTSSVQWNSSIPLVATINPAGLATAVGLGTTSVSASLGSVSGQTNLTVIVP